MSQSALACCDDRRRAAVRAADDLAGIDYIEIDTDDTGVPLLLVYFLTRLPADGAPPLFTDANIRIEGGRRVRDLRGTLRDFRRAPTGERDDYAVIALDRAGDHSVYTLRLVADAADPDSVDPPPGFDPRYVAAPFSFVADGPVQVDCAPVPRPPVTATAPPDLNYLARDYASFRQMLLDRLAVTLPGWRERHTPDLYLTLVEALAYLGDELSYFQDAVATEAYLGTARRRVSIRRHARLVDYTLHEGCNARAWVCVEVEGTVRQSIDALSFLTRPPGHDPAEVALPPGALRAIPRASYEIFEPLMEAERGTICERDIHQPGELARRLREERTPLVREVRARLSIETLGLLAAEVSAEALPALIAALARDLDRLLPDSGLALVARAGRERAIAHHGTPNALHGAAARRYNRAQLVEAFADELDSPTTLVFHEAHNTIHIYTWGRAGCHLPKGATSATLRDAWEGEPGGARALRHLRPGEVLILEEVIDPATGNPADADPTHRHPVRLTRVESAMDSLYEQPVVEIAWATADALPFALPLSAVGPAPACRLLECLSVARGNVVLVDHGETVREADVVRLRDGATTIVANPFPPPHDRVPPDETAAICCSCGGSDEAMVRAGRYEPVLPQAPLVFSQPLPISTPPAAVLFDQDPRLALPQLALFSPLTRPRRGADVVERLADSPYSSRFERPYERWRPRADLLGSTPDERHFVVEIDDDRRAHARFGDGECGARPAAGTSFLAAYRIGDNLAGNVGAEAIGHVLLREDTGGGTIRRVRNPLAARGGTAAETVAHARLLAPHAFRRVLRRAITAEDYAAIVERDFGATTPRDATDPVPTDFARKVQRAAARIAPTAGGQAAVAVLIDPVGTEADNPALLAAIGEHLERYRRIGHAVTVRQAEYTALDLGLTARIGDHFERGAVRGALMAALGGGVLPDGSLGFFHPDRWTFGQPVPLSAIVAAARAVAGVSRVRVTHLRRLGQAGTLLPAGGALVLEAQQVAQLASDPDFPEHGVLTLTIEGGR